MKNYLFTDQLPILLKGYGVFKLGYNNKAILNKMDISNDWYGSIEVNRFN